MNDDWGLFTEEVIITGVMRFLDERVNELLAEGPLMVPSLDVGGSAGVFTVCPEVVLLWCERTEKERIVRLDAYTLTVTFPVPESEEAERYCYAYAAAVDRGLDMRPLWTGAANRTVLTGKRYKQPKTPGCGEGWEVVLTLRVTFETMSKINEQ